MNTFFNGIFAKLKIDARAGTGLFWRPQVLNLLLALSVLSISAVSFVKLWGMVSTVESPRFILDMRVEGPFGGNIELWLNDDKRSPKLLPVITGKRHVYKFSITEEAIDRIRLDPTTVNRTRITIYSISIVDGDRVLARFTAPDIAKWGRRFLKIERVDGDAVLFTATTHDPTVVTDIPRISVPQPGLLKLKPLFSKQWRSIALFVFVFTAFIMIGFEGLFRSGRGQLATLGVLFLTVYAAHQGLLELKGTPPDAARAVGFVGYYGYAKNIERLSAIVLFASAIFAGIAAWLLVRRYPRWLSPGLVKGNWDASPAERKWGTWAIACVAVVLALYFVPDLAKGLASLKTGNFTPQWDSNNFLTWSYLFQTGELPYRDFWYPYAGQILKELPFPFGQAFSAFHLWLFWTLLAVAIYLNCGKSLAQTLGLFSMLFLLYLLGAFHAIDRYGPIVTIILSYLAIDQGANALQWRHSLFWIATIQAGLYEPIGLFAAGFAIALLLIVEAITNRATFLKGLVWRLGRDFTVPMAAFGVLAYVLATNGLLGPILEFYWELGDLSLFGALPAPIGQWLFPPPFAESFVFWAGAILTAMGVHGLITPSSSDRRTAAILMALGIATLVLFSKQLVRPHIAWQMAFVPVVAFAFYLVRIMARSGRAARSAMWVSVGIVMAIFYLSGTFQGFVRDMASAPERLRSASKLFPLTAEHRTRLVEMRFAPRKFKNYPGYSELSLALRKKFKTGLKSGLFVLSDDPLLYVATRQRPPHQINLYNGSAIGSQRRLVGWLRNHRPQFVAWDANDLLMDGIPKTIRNPIVFAFIVTNYVPDTKVSQFHLLRRRQPQEPIAIDFWRQTLGSRIDLGHLPLNSHPERYRTCATESDEKCVDVLFVKAGPKARAKGGAMITAIAGKHRFTIAFKTATDTETYIIRLDRLWFWDALKKQIPMTELKWEISSNDLTVRTRLQKPVGDFLY